MVVGVVVALAREVDPLGVAKLVAHKVEVGARAAEGGQAGHLVQGQTAVDVEVVRAHVHRLVHRLVEHLEDEGLAAHERLVVRLDVVDGQLVGAAVGNLVPEEADGPIFVAHVAHQLEPALGHAHRHPVVKADALLGEGRADAGHPAHVLGHGERVGADGVDDLVGEGEVGLRVLVHGAVEVHSVVGEVDAQAVMEVEHRGDAVEAVAIEVILIEPEAAVGEKEVQDVGLAVVEATRIPGIVPAARAVVEVLVGRAIEEGKAVALVLHGVGVDDVHNDGQAHPVGGVNHRLEFLGRAEARASRVEARDVVAKAAVIGMLHNPHQLDGVVAGLLDAREDLLGELGVGAHALALLGHPHVRLVDERRAVRPHEGVLPRIGLGLPDLRGEEATLGVLHHAPDVGGQTLAAPAGPVHFQPEELLVLDGLRRAGPLKDLPPGQALGLVLGQQLPVREVPHQPNIGGVGGPLAEDPALGGLVQTVVLVGAGEGGQGFGGGSPGQPLNGLLRPARAAFNDVGIGCKPRIIKQTSARRGHRATPFTAGCDRGSGRSLRPRRAR